MKKIFALLTLFGILFVACSDDDCERVLPTTLIEIQYQSENTNIELNYGEHLIIRTQEELESLTNISFDIEIDFSVYDLFITKIGLSSGSTMIERNLVRNCDNNNLKMYLKLTILDAHTHDAPTIFYNVLIPKMENNQVLIVEYL